MSGLRISAVCWDWKFTDAPIFAYSMLYPVSDNYLEIERSKAEKIPH